MNDRLSEALADILESAAATADQAKDFVLAELPDIANQLLLWKLTESLIACAFGLLIILAVAAFWCFIRRQYQQDADWLRPSHGTLPVMVFWVYVFGIGFSGALLIFSSHLLNLVWLQILLAPKLYLIEYAAQLRFPGLN